MKKLLLTLSLFLAAASAHATTTTFSGVITSVEIVGDSWIVQAKVGDPFSGTVFYNSDMSRMVGRVDVVDAHWNVEWPWPTHGDHQFTYDFYIFPNNGFEFDTNSAGLWGGGTDDGASLFGNQFNAYVADHAVDDNPHVYVQGTVTKQVVFVPDTGSTIALLGAGLLTLALFQKRRL